MKVLPDGKMGQKLFSNAKFCLDSTVSHQFQSGHRPFILSYDMWMEQELQKIYSMSAKIRSCLFSRSSIAHIFETYTHKKIAVGRNYVSLSSPSPRWLHFKRLTVVRMILCDKWGVRGGGGPLRLGECQAPYYHGLSPLSQRVVMYIRTGMCKGA